MVASYFCFLAAVSMWWEQPSFGAEHLTGSRHSCCTGPCVCRSSSALHIWSRDSNGHEMPVVALQGILNDKLFAMSVNPPSESCSATDGKCTLQPPAVWHCLLQLHFLQVTAWELSTFWQLHQLTAIRSVRLLLSHAVFPWSHFKAYSSQPLVHWETVCLYACVERGKGTDTLKTINMK